MRIGKVLAAIGIVGIIINSFAFAMTQSSIPGKFGVPWGNSAGPSYIRAIPQASQIGIQNCAASLTDGFPPLTFTPSASGGCPPFGADFNGILKQITQWSQWQSAGGPVFWDSAFSTSIGGYPKGAVLQSSVLVGRLWLSTADNNTTNPDDQTGAAANWIAMPGTYTAGTPVPGFAATTPPANTVSANGLTVGNASSNATGRANVDTFWLFSYLWTNCGTCTLFNSGGGVVGKGASAVADWAANRAIATVQLNGAGLQGSDTQGSVTTSLLTGVPVTSGSLTTTASIIGENVHTLTAGQIPTITSSGSNSLNSTVSDVGRSSTPSSTGGGGFNFNYPSVFTGITVSGTVSVTSNNTGGQSHNVVDRNATVAWWLSL